MSRNYSNPSMSKIWYFIFWILIFVVLWLLGQIEIKFGNISLSEFEDKNYTFSLSWIQNIRWTLAVSPYDSFEKYSESLEKMENRFLPSPTNRDTEQEWQDKTIKLYTYDFTEQKIKEQFRKLLEDWAKIQVIMENYKYMQYKDTRTATKEYFSHYSGFQLHSDKGLQTQYQHAKVTLLNDWFWINTANLTHSSFFKNREYWFHSNNAEILKSLTTIFDKDWNQEQILETDIHPNLVICPFNCREGVETLLKHAKESIIMQEQYLSDDSIVNILKQKADADNFNLKITLANPSDNYKRAKYFWTHRVRVVKNPYIHAKMILIDKKYLLLGSMNISSTSLDKNREIGIIITDKKIIEKFLSQFQNDWGKSEH